MTTIVPSAMPPSSKLSVSCSFTPPMPMMMPAAAGTRFSGLRRSTPPLIQICAPSRPIIPYRITVIPPSTPPGIAATTAPNLGHRPKSSAKPAAAQ